MSSTYFLQFAVMEDKSSGIVTMKLSFETVFSPDEGLPLFEPSLPLLLFDWQPVNAKTAIIEKKRICFFIKCSFLYKQSFVNLIIPC